MQKRIMTWVSIVAISLAVAGYSLLGGHQPIHSGPPVSSTPATIQSCGQGNPCSTPATIIAIPR